MTIDAHRWLMTAVERAARARRVPRRARPRRGRRRGRRLRRLPHRPRLLLRRRAHQPPAAAGARPRDQRPRGRRRRRRAGWIGKAVIVPAVLPCGECDLCRRGLAPICRAQKMPGNDIQGGFATHIVVPARGLCAVDEARLARAGLTLAEVSIVADALTTPYQAVRRAGVDAGQPRDRRRRRRRRRLLRADRPRVRREGRRDRRRRRQARGDRAARRRADARRPRARRQGASRRRSTRSPRRTACARPSGSSSSARAPRPAS